MTADSVGVTKLYLVRDLQNPYFTMGYFLLRESRVCETLELPWRGNLADVSCIPAAEYPIQWRWSEKHGCNLWHIDGVPARSASEIHVGNSVKDTKGCVLVGVRREPTSIVDSRVALDDLSLRLHDAFPLKSGALVVTHADALR